MHFPLFQPFVEVGLKADSQAVKNLACKTVSKCRIMYYCSFSFNIE